jgi:hypothetical protein
MMLPDVRLSAHRGTWLGRRAGAGRNAKRDHKFPPPRDGQDHHATGREIEWAKIVRDANVKESLPTVRRIIAMDYERYRTSLIKGYYDYQLETLMSGFNHRPCNSFAAA